MGQFRIREYSGFKDNPEGFRGGTRVSTGGKDVPLRNGYQLRFSNPDSVFRQDV